MVHGRIVDPFENPDRATTLISALGARGCSEPSPHQPLPFGADDAAFILANTRLRYAAKAHGAEAPILSAGWDAHRDDPLSKLAVSTDAYARIGDLYGRFRLPTLIVQEGGYSLEVVAAASHAFICAFRDAHR